MRAARYTEHGGPEVLNVIQTPDSERGSVDVMVGAEGCARTRLSSTVKFPTW